MINQNKIVLITMPVNCDCGRVVWLWFRDVSEHEKYKCKCGLRIGEKLIIVESVLDPENSLDQEH